LKQLKKYNLGNKSQHMMGPDISSHAAPENYTSTVVINKIKII